MTDLDPDPAHDHTANAAPGNVALRKRAQAQWQAIARQSPQLPGEAMGEANRALLEELHVHQIQLEMQNQELQLAQTALEEARAHYFDLYDFAPVGYCTLNDAGVMLQANLTLATLLGVARSALRKEVLSRFIVREDQAHFHLLRQRLLAAAEPDADSGSAPAPRAAPATVSIEPPAHDAPCCELRVRKGDGTVFWALLSATAVATPTWVGGQTAAGGGWVLRLTLNDITALKRAQAALSEGEARWRFALEGAADGLWDWNIQTGEAFYSPRYKEMLGFAEDEIGNTADEWNRRIYPDDAPGVLAALQPYMDGKPGTATVEFRMLCKDGSWQWTLGRGMVILRDADGKPLRMIGTNTDITGRKQEQAELLASKARLRTVVDSTREAIAVHQAGKVVFVNPAAMQMMGAASQDELLGKPILDFVHPDFRSIVLERVKRQVEDGLSMPMIDEKFLRLDGTAIDVEVQPTSIMYRGQAAIQVTMRDITAHKQAQARLRLAASVFEHAREGITITDAWGTIVEVNAAFTRVTGYSRQEAIGRNPRMLNSGRQDPAFYGAMWRDLLALGHWSGEVWNRRKDGQMFAELLTISAVRDAQGHTQQYVALFSDITTIKEQQNELDRRAHFDALTNLPNRLLLADRLEQALAQATRRANTVAVVFLDLDGFKAVNDAHGHGVGDHLLSTLATRMKQALREGDTLARIGGDEFVAVLADLTDAQDWEPLLTRLLAAAAQPVLVGDIPVQVTVSLGVTFYPQADDIAAHQLLRQADQAMYQAKLAGKNRYHVFAPG